MFMGYKKGFVLKLIGIVTFFVAGILCWFVSGFVMHWITIYPKGTNEIIDLLLYDQLNRLAVFVVLFLLLQAILLVIRPALHILNHIPVVSLLNRLLGCALGLIQAFLILFLITMALRLPLWEQGNMIASNSWLHYSDPMAKWALFYIKEPLTQMQKLSDTAQQKESLTKQEAHQFYEWLIQQNISKEDADDLMDMLRVE